MRDATYKAGGIYCYSNQMGCDGDGHVYYDGGPMIIVNGELVSLGEPFWISSEVQVAVATIDLRDIWAFRQSISNHKNLILFCLQENTFKAPKKKQNTQEFMSTKIYVSLANILH